MLMARPSRLRPNSRGVSPEEIYSKYQAEFLDSWERLGISFDLFTTTHTDNHAEVSQDIFSRLLERGYIYKDTMVQPFCENERRFLADRYVEGTCPHCNFDGARGDQCDNCGRTLDPKDLLGMACRICGSAPEFRETEHFFLKLSAFQDQLLDWVRKQEDWRPNVRNFTIGYLEAGLRDRAITRDIEWGVRLPLEGYEDKRLYVWFEAVIGYLSASIEWAKSAGQPEAWKPFWEDGSRAYYFMGKDNIPFHTVIWPAMLLGYGGLKLPYDVPANEYLNLEGFKLSTSRNWAVWLPDYLDRYEPDPLRYVIAANLPETSDSDFSWREYVRRNNDELVATYGNLVHRVLSMINRNFDGVLPEPGELDDASNELLTEAKRRFNDTERYLEAVRLRQALQSSMALAQATNRYLDKKEPWRAVRQDKDDAAKTLWTAVSVINCLKTTLYPFLPFSSQKLHGMLGFEENVEDSGWTWDACAIRPGQKIQRPTPLFQKLDEEIIEAEEQRLSD